MTTLKNSKSDKTQTQNMTKKKCDKPQKLKKLIEKIETQNLIN